MVVIERSRLQKQTRDAAVSLLKGYAAASGVKLQVYRARPASIHAPTAFVDRMTETIESFTVTLNQRTVRAEVILVHGLFDSGEAVDQKDDFVDEFLDYVTDRYHEAGANTDIRVTSIEDLPDWVNDWFPPSEQRTWYATRITLEGFAGG